MNKTYLSGTQERRKRSYFSLVPVFLLSLAISSSALAENVSVAPGPEETPTVTSVSSSGSVARGAHRVTFVFSSDFTGTVGGVAYNGASDASQSFTASLSSKLGAIAYTVTTGSIRIVQVK